VVRPIVFCSDYGLSDDFVGVCHGAIARIAPEVRVIDLTHGIQAMNVVHGASVLNSSTRYMPRHCVYLAVVDPGVGSARRAVAVQAGSGALLVGPDNGLLSMAWEALGGASAAVDIASDEVILQPRSATFDGRDVFAPAAAHLAMGRDLSFLGPEVAVDSLVRLDVPRPVVADGQVRCAVLAIDRFGNVQLSATAEHLEKSGLAGRDELVLDTDEAGAVMVRPARTFSDVGAGQVALIVDSSGWLSAVMNGGNLAEALRVAPVVLSRVG